MYISGGASPLLMTGHTCRHVNSRISKCRQIILIYNFIITPFESQAGGICARANAMARPLVTLPLVYIPHVDQ